MSKVKICPVCGFEVIKVTSLMPSAKYKCENCHTLIAEENVLFKSDLLWRATHKLPPCKVKGLECESHSECDRKRCTSYQNYELRRNKVKAIMDAEKAHISMMRDAKYYAIKHNRGKVSAI